MTAEGAHRGHGLGPEDAMTLASAERAFARAGLEVVDRELFFVRPEYTVRYGLEPRGAGFLGRAPMLRELGVNGAFYLLERKR